MKKEKAIFEYSNKKYFVKDIAQAFIETGIKKGDSVFVHSDLKAFGRICSTITREDYIEAFIKALQLTIGEKGNLIMPTFSYSFCDNLEFNPETTPSKVGVMTEYFRKMEGVVRSQDPIFSVAATGPKKDYFVDVGTDCFGKKSIFDKLYKCNAKLVFIGPRFDITFMHYIEQKFGVPYRFIKEFSGKIRQDNISKDATYQYYVRYLDRDIEYDLEKIAGYLEKCRVLNKKQLGYSQIRVISARNAFSAITDGLKKEVFMLLKNKPVGF